MAEAEAQRSVRTCAARDVVAGMTVKQSRQEREVVGAVNTSASRRAITTKDAAGKTHYWVGDLTDEWQVVG